MADKYWAALAESPRLSRSRKQGSRRTIVALYLASLATLLLVTWFVDSYWPLAPLIAVSTITIFLLHAGTRGILGFPTDSLDEQQIAVRNAAYKVSYPVGMVIALATGFAVSEILDWDTAFGPGLILAAVGFLTGLPTMVVAWTLPGETVDED